MYYEDAKENAAFERCTDVITNMIMKYGPVLKRKWAVDEWLRNIHVECFGTKNEWRSFMAEDKKGNCCCSNKCNRRIPERKTL